MSTNLPDPTNDQPTTTPQPAQTAPPTAGQRLDRAVAGATAWRGQAGRRVQQEWSRRSASNPNFKWYAIGGVVALAVLAFLVLGTAHNGGSSEDIKAKFAKIVPGMTPEEVQAIMGPPEDIDGLSDGSQTSMEWMRDEGRYHISFTGGKLSRKFLDTFYTKSERDKRAKQEH